MPIIRADLRDLDRLDIQGRGSPVPPFPPRRILNNAEKAALKAAVDLWAVFRFDEAPIAPLIKQVIEVSESRPTIVVKKPNTVQVNDGAFTLALGFNPEAFVVGGVTGTVGIYGSTTGELGVFGSIGPGFWFPNVGASTALTLTGIFGPPSDLSGLAWGLGCDVVLGPTWGGLLLFGPTGGPWRPSSPIGRFLGVTVSVSTPGASRFDLTYQLTYTATRPIVRPGS